MRIVIDATPLLVRGGGVKSYEHGWLKALLRARPSGLTIAMYPFLRELRPLDHLASPKQSLGSWLRVVLANFVNVRHSPAIELFARRADLFHASHLLRNLPRKMPVTATVFDMTCWLLPEMHTPANVRATRRYGDETLRRARGLIAISERTRRDCIEILGIPEENIEVIYPGVPDEFFDVNGEAAERSRRNCGLSKPYILFLGCIEPRKNLGVLLDAWQQVRQSTKGDCELVIAGPTGWNSDHVVARLASTGGVRWLGYVPETSLPGLIKGAELLVYPSLYEGFGLPVVQAMAAGTPVVTSNTSCLPEVAGGAAYLVDPKEPSAVAAAIETVLFSSELRTRLSAEGRQRAERYRWQTAAEKSIRFFLRQAEAAH